MTRRIKSEDKRRSPYKATEEQLNFLEENYGKVTMGNLVKMYNTKFPSNPITNWQIYRFNYKYGWKEKSQNPPHRNMSVWNKEMIEYCRLHAKEYTYREMANKLNEVFGTDIKEEQITSMYTRYGITNDKQTAFHKGHVPANKGKKWEEYLTPEQQEAAKKGCYKKGHRPDSYKPLGSIVIRRDCHRKSCKGYRWIKVKDDRTDNYQLYARYIYEQHYGVKLNTDDLIVHLDGDSLNDDIDNLFLVKNTENGTLNKSYKVSDNPELTKASILTIRLNQKIKRRRV